MVWPLTFCDIIAIQLTLIIVFIWCLHGSLVYKFSALQQTVLAREMREAFRLPIHPTYVRVRPAVFSEGPAHQEMSEP